MADLLTQILVLYVVLTVTSWQIDWVTKRWVVIGMAGSAIPDLAKIGLIVENELIESVVGIPFSYAPISTFGGVLVIAAAITVFFAHEQLKIYGSLVFGGVVALITDGLRVFADGHAGPWLYPFTWWRPPTPSLYVTSDVRILIIALLVSAIVFEIDHWDRLVRFWGR